MISPERVRHHIILVKTSTFGMIEFLQKLLLDKDKEIVIAKDEVLDVIYSAIETMTMTETFTASVAHNAFIEAMALSETTTLQAPNYPVEFVFSGSIPSGTQRAFILDGSPLV